MKLTGAQALIKSLEMEGVEVMFGLPGGAILPVYDPLIDSSIRHILVRHEQGAGHMASGYAHVTGRPGVAMVTSGPAATNVVTALCDAYMDSVPVVCITGQVPYSVIGTDAFQEADTVGITMPVTKHNWLITDANDIPRIIREAFHVATTGRPGPVLVDVPKDIANQQMEWYWPETVEMPGYKPTIKGHPKQVKDAARLINEAQRPVIYAGGGILKSRAPHALREFAELTGIHVVTTLMARGAFPDDHELCLGMPGMHGNYTAVTSMQKADLLIALGSRFDDRVTGKVGAFAPDAKIIHVDIDPAEQGKVRVPRCADRRRLPPRDRGAREGGEGRAAKAQQARPVGVERAARRLAAPVPDHLQAGRRRPTQAAVLHRDAAREHARRHDLRLGCGPTPDVGEPALEVQPAVYVGELGRPRHDGLRGAGRGRRQGRDARPDGVGHRR